MGKSSKGRQSLSIKRSDSSLSSRRHKYRRSSDDNFKCVHCRRFIGPPLSGGHHRNHCPFCLYSRHVDDRVPGDRMSLCGASMQPIGTFQRPNGEFVLVHRCPGCGFERFNRIAADDDFDLVLALPSLPPRSAHEMKSQRMEQLDEQLEEQEDVELEDFEPDLTSPLPSTHKAKSKRRRKGEWTEEWEDIELEE